METREPKVGDVVVLLPTFEGNYTGFTRFVVTREKFFKFSEGHDVVSVYAEKNFYARYDIALWLDYTRDHWRLEPSDGIPELP